MTDFIHPALLFILGALPIPFLSGSVRKAYLLLIPALAILAVLAMEPGTAFSILLGRGCPQLERQDWLSCVPRRPLRVAATQIAIEPLAQLCDAHSVFTLFCRRYPQLTSFAPQDIPLHTSGTEFSFAFTAGYSRPASPRHRLSAPRARHLFHMRQPETQPRRSSIRPRRRT